MKKLLNCVLCGEVIKPNPITGWAGGNNAEPLAEGRCCNVCNDFVIIARLQEAGLMEAPKESV